MFLISVYWKRRTRGHGHADTDRRTQKTDSDDVQLWKRRAVMEKTGTYGKGGHKAFESEIFNRETLLYNQYYTFNTSYRTYVLRHL